jgi:outer membrane immunogenic protein
LRASKGRHRRLRQGFEDIQPDHIIFNRAEILRSTVTYWAFISHLGRVFCTFSVHNAVSCRVAAIHRSNGNASLSSRADVTGDQIWGLRFEKEGYMAYKFWRRIGLLASMLAGAGAASAADMPVKAPPRVAPVAPVYLSDWAGFYIGVNGGGAWADNKFDNFPAQWNAKPSGGLVGGHAGYNWQYGNVVAGIEGDFDGAFLEKKLMPAAGVTFKEKTDELATARARVGYVVWPSLLAYGTAGAAFGHTEITKATMAGSTVDGLDQFGWAAGAGLEYKIWDHVLVRAEYLHYDFGKETGANFGPIKESVDAVRGGVSYKF